MFTNQLTLLAPPRHVLGAVTTATRVEGSDAGTNINTETSLVFAVARAPVVRHYRSGREHKADVVARLIEVKSLRPVVLTPPRGRPVHKAQEGGVRSPWR